MAEVLPSGELVAEESDYGSLRPGTRLGRYELLVPIARGGMARVWAARLHGQRGFQKLVALKTILPHLASEAEFERMFLDEARIAAGVHHPNVCEIYELGEEQRTLYLAMEWVSGDSLARVLRPGGRPEAIDPRVAARILADACAGVHAAHELTDDDGRELGVVHRDLSPHNVLLTADGVTKVADFGVAKALGQLHEATSAGQLKGKVSYMAPEQITGAPIDRRSDIFSLGCVLYEVTTGMRPFRGDGDHQVMHAVLKGEFEPPSAIVRGYPQELERIIQRALSPQAILRYPTAERMRFALEELLARGPLVTQSNVAQLVRARIGEGIDQRKEQIRQASTIDDADPPWTGGVRSRQPQGRSGSGSGVQTSRPVGAAGAASSTTIPQAAIAPSPGQPRASSPAFTPSPPGATYEAPGGHAAAHAVPPSPPSPSIPDRSQPGYSQPGHSAPSSPSFPGGSNPGVPAAPFAGPGSGGSPSYGAYQAGYQVAPSQGATPPSPAVQYMLAVGAGLLIAAAIGGAGYLAWRSQRAEVASGPPDVAPSGAAVSADQGTPSTSDITFATSPPDARLVVDGRELALGTRTIPRPAQGQSVTVIARAPNHEDTTVVIDASTKSPVGLALKRNEAPVVANAMPADGPEDEATSDEPERGGTGEPQPVVKKDDSSKADRPKPKKPALPANPY
jgi:eukaryotic-like serine/threonine-protein kinase